jgi:putative membrane protein
MAQQMSYREPRVWKGALAGAVAGLAAAWVMTRFHVALSGRGLSNSENPQSNKPVDGEGDDAAMEAAERVAEAVTDRPLTQEAKAEWGGPAAHYAFGMAAGALYGMARETQHAPGGAAFGAELWVIADQVGLPMVGLTPWPLASYPAATNAQHLAAHIVYGVTTALVFTGVRRAL